MLPVFGYGTESLGKLVHQIRLIVIEEAARESVDVIFTFVYAHPTDLPLVDQICAVVEAHGGTVCFVQLTCDREVQEQRVLVPERARRQKARSVDLIRDWNERHDLVTPVPQRPSLIIDNTAVPAIEAAQRIAEHYGLLPSSK